MAGNRILDRTLLSVLKFNLVKDGRIVVTASDKINEFIGLEVGADDYVTKPFSMRELLSRIHAMIRRSEI